MGEAVRQELLQMGFTKELNPFITVIRLLLKHSLQLNAQQYGTIHNGFLQGLLSEEDLAKLGNNPPFDSKNELLLKKVFYSKDGKTRQQLLACRREIADWFKKQNATPELISQINKVFYTPKSLSQLNPIEQILIKASNLLGKKVGTDPNRKASFVLNNTLKSVLAGNQSNAALAVNSIIAKLGLKINQIKNIITTQAYPEIKDDFMIQVMLYN